jgi:deferrochelatase/peroxidase EfeB
MKLGLGERCVATFPIAFQQGMAAKGRARALGDDPDRWRWGGDGDVDALLLVYAATRRLLGEELAARKAELQRFGLATLAEIPLDEVRQPLVEPFGFRDGVSQPVLRGSTRSARLRDAADIVEPGEIVLGYRDNLGIVPPMPRTRGRDIGRNGTYLVVRQLEQDVAGFRDYVSGKARDLAQARDPRVPPGSREALEHWIAAKMMGRWRDGSSLVRHPDRPGIWTGESHVPDNDFRLGSEDPVGLRCPLGSHIRRANPRDSFDPGSSVQVGITNRHRILRVGRRYEHAPGENPGLMFMCLNADIERQFEFLQQTWILGADFHGLGEIDPIVGYGPQGETMTIPTPGGPLRLDGLAKFVTMRGGGYFFLPGRSTVRFLAGLA